MSNVAPAAQRPLTILITKHEPVHNFVTAIRQIDLSLPSFYREHLSWLPRGSTVIGNLPVPVVAQICAAGHHYEHVIIPNASNPEARTEAALRSNASLLEFHVEEID